MQAARTNKTARGDRRALHFKISILRSADNTDYATVGANAHLCKSGPRLNWLVGTDAISPVSLAVRKSQRCTPVRRSCIKSTASRGKQCCRIGRKPFGKSAKIRGCAV